MAQQNSPNDHQRSPGGSDPQFNWRGMVLISIAIMLLGSAFLYSKWGDRGYVVKPMGEFLQMLESEGVLEVSAERPLELVRDSGTGEEFLTGFFLDPVPGAPAGATPRLRRFRTPVNVLYEKDELRRVLDGKGIVLSHRYESSMMGSLLISFLPLLLIILLLVFFFRQQVKMAGRGAMSFGKSKAKMLAMDKNKITFRDVAGVDEAKEEV
jgi:cell division protease FtsH